MYVRQGYESTEVWWRNYRRLIRTEGPLRPQIWIRCAKCRTKEHKWFCMFMEIQMGNCGNGKLKIELANRQCCKCSWSLFFGGCDVRRLKCLWAER